MSVANNILMSFILHFNVRNFFYIIQKVYAVDYIFNIFISIQDEFF